MREGRGGREELPSRDKIYMTLGIDPGRKDILTVKDMHNKHVRYTAKQHYAEAGIYKFTRKVAALQASAPDFVKRAYKYGRGYAAIAQVCGLSDLEHGNLSA
ncbi:hypothetical protein APUTEX25_005555 [Auxenochlorella protothecoides]|uniref:Uncharacterized protein n=1 Tax=Auxenochlorella protothecoides TaxID=3075 RepID=A0A3M7KY76_AUXPR|nr:hypothetical protein APUTEX25_005555 [Auxenochlorella protothecoides]|eukprot:RMZ55277.1 hypothetical protein APUTEX25_005555 [Auxenochlorella protothecoides]